MASNEIISPTSGKSTHEMFFDLFVSKARGIYDGPDDATDKAGKIASLARIIFPAEQGIIDIIAAGKGAGSGGQEGSSDDASATVTESFNGGRRRFNTVDADVRLFGGLPIDKSPTHRQATTQRLSHFIADELAFRGRR